MVFWGKTPLHFDLGGSPRAGNTSQPLKGRTPHVYVSSVFWFFVAAFMYQHLDRYAQARYFGKGAQDDGGSDGNRIRKRKEQGPVGEPDLALTEAQGRRGY